VLQTPSILCETQRRLVIVFLALYMYMFECTLTASSTTTHGTNRGAALLFRDQIRDHASLGAIGLPSTAPL
jgi:hypothetical protein